MAGSRHLRSTLAAAPVLLAHAVVTVLKPSHFITPSGCQIRRIPYLMLVPQTREAVLAAGMVPAVVAALSTHTTVADVQLYGCWALANLSLTAACHASVVSGGGIQACLNAVVLHTRSVCVYACMHACDVCMCVHV